MTKNYLITCKQCKSKRQVGIIENNGRELIDWLDNNPNPEVAKILSGRKRFDSNWGWSCICGNDDIMTDQEKEYISNHQSPSPQDITSVINNLKAQKPLFEMRVL